MTREEAKIIRYRYKYFNYEHIDLVVDEIYDAFQKEKEQLKKEKEYWKLSFEKQVEASRRK